MRSRVDAAAAIAVPAPDGRVRIPPEITAMQQHADRDRAFIALAESAVSPVISMTPDGTIITWNPAAEGLYGYAAAEAIGASIDIIVPPDCRDQYRAVVNRVIASKSGDDFETLRTAKDGREIDVLVIVSAIQSATGEVVGVVNITRDITGRKIAEEKFRLAVEACPNGMMMSDAAGIIVMVNSEVERLFGYRREELIGRPVDDLVPERLRRQHRRHRDGYGHNPEQRRMSGGRDVTGLRKDGTEFPAEVGLNPIQTRDGLMVLSAIVDISERKRLDRLKDEFVSMVSHELRTPLTSIAGSLGLLMGNAAGHLPDAAVRLLTIAHSNSQRLVRLINDILDLEKIEAGQVAFHLRHLDLRALVEQTIDANRAFADGFKVRICLDEASADGAVLGDPDRLTQVLTNLLSNAVKYSPSGGEVEVAIERRGDDLRVAVRDHGPGIPEEFKARIFEKFAQADSAEARQKGGTGLGLSIVKELIHQHGGKMGFDAAPGGGTIFYFDLPPADAADTTARDLLLRDDAAARREEPPAMKAGAA
jgi:PAS domain S-box-containing protein